MEDYLGRFLVCDNNVCLRKVKENSLVWTDKEKKNKK